MLTGFHSAVIEVADFESALGDYARMLGHEAPWIEHDASRRTRSALFPLANMMLEIRASETDSEPTSEEGTLGLAGLRLAWDEPEQFRAELQSNATLRLPGVHEVAAGPDAGTSRCWTSTQVDLVVSRSISVELISDEEGPRPVWNGSAVDPVEAGSIDPRSTIRGLDHVVVFSGDIEATRDFYAIRLGIRLALDRSFEKRGVRLIFFRVGGVTIEIGGRLDAEPRPDSLDRFGGLAWQVLELDAIQSRLRADRFDVSEIRDGNKPGTRVCTVRDPVHAVPTLLIEPAS